MGKPNYMDMFQSSHLISIRDSMHSVLIIPFGFLFVNSKFTPKFQKAKIILSDLLTGSLSTLHKFVNT